MKNRSDATGVLKQAEDFSEIGSTGLNHFAGEIFEEKLRALQNDRRDLIYKEMEDNDSVAGAILFVIEMLIRQVEWTVTEADQSPQSQDAKEFLISAMNDMDMPFKEVISNVLGSMLPHGYAPAEMVFKRRSGRPFFSIPGDTTNEPGSRFSDGLIGWHKISVRAPETVSKWKISDNGDIQGLWQKPPPKFEEVFIPMEKILLFRTSTKKNNPEGRSILRNAFRSWFFKKKIENIEAIGIERDLAGLPVALVPPEIMANNAGPDEKAIFQKVKKIVINLRRDEQEGVVFPMIRDDKGNLMYELKLLSTGGTRQFKTNDTIQRYRQDMAMTVLADFILLGHEKVGSFSLSSSKTNVFTMAIGAWLEMIADVLNRKAVPMLFWINGLPTDNLPQFTFGDIESIDLGQLSQYLTALTGAGIDLTDQKTQDFLKGQANIPASSTDDSI